MKLKIEELAVLQCQGIERSQAQYPYFLPLMPIGYRSGDIEAMSSYVCRQSEQQMELAHPFSRRLLIRYVSPENLPACLKLPASGLKACNGFGVMSERFIEAINTATEGIFDAKYLTYCPLQPLNDPSSRGLQRQNLAWCSDCWREDVAQESTPYVRLYWLCQQTRICVHHNSRLSEFCPACGDVQHQFPAFPRQWVCNRCGHDLYEHDADYVAENYTNEEAWASHSIYRLIERINQAQTEPRRDAVKRAIDRLLLSLKISSSEFAECLNVDVKMINNILSGERKPYFPAFMDLCYRLDIPPDHFVFDREVLTAKELWKNIDKPIFGAASNLSDHQKRKIARALKKVIKSRPTPPIRVSHFARKHEISYSALFFNFRDEYNELRRRWLKWQQEHRRHHNTDRLQYVAEAVFSLARNGIYPSDRKLRDLGYVIPSDLRREDVVLVLRALQEVYSNLKND